MATVIFSAAGAALGGSVGGTLAGLSSVAIGRAVGATLGRVVDQRLLGQGGQAVETGKVDRFRLTRSGEGEPVARVFGRMRLGGQVIWVSDFRETVNVSGGGKGARPTPQTPEYSYAVSLAVAVCKGVISGIGRVWADGEEIATDDLNMRVYTGTADQLPDPVMEAVEGTGKVPAYRRTAYVVFEDLQLAPFGNRVPQFSFEVLRPEQPGAPGWEHVPTYGLRGVALIPGTGEYALATTEVSYIDAAQGRWSANVNTPQGKSDFAVSLDALETALPNVEAASLVVSWFGNDLRCGSCTIRPKVEDRTIEGENMPWRVSGQTRNDAEVIAREAGRPIYGGTPTDQSVIEAIRAMTDAGKAVMFYPFILMDQVSGNTLPDPYSDADTQPHLPWRGRITLSVAPGRPGSPDGTAQAAAEVDAFFGSVTASDFAVEAGSVQYSGPDEWSLSRFILHYAAVCAAAGGVESFCISSEMRGLTWIRGAGDSFPAVHRLRALAAEVRALLGSQVRIGYAADWSEYFGYQPQDGSGDVFFHLDPLWADDNIDFIGIDNYMPLADWREGQAHIDAERYAAIYDLEYLRGNIEGGEGYDWYYHSPEARAAQIRTPITDNAYDEAWVFRFKDIRNWWGNAHHERRGGVRQEAPTAWLPGSKPIWFTEYGCAAVDKGANEPNKFLDLRSSESALPRYSTGARDDLMQLQYLRAISSYWDDPARNPVATAYAGRMLDMRRAFVWAWDVRPYPVFPNNRDLWSDGEHHARGHWINGRTTARTLASVVGEICRDAGLGAFSTEGLHGYVRGYAFEQVADARTALQPLMLRHGFDAVERDGILSFRQRNGLGARPLVPERLAVSGELDGVIEQLREAEAEVSGRVRLRFVQADGDFDVIAEEAVSPDETTHAVSASELNMALTRTEGRQVAERWLTEARVAREQLRIALPPSLWALGAGDVIELPGEGQEGPGRYRIDRVEQLDARVVDAVRIEPEVYTPSDLDDVEVPVRPFVAPTPVTAQFLDLPLLRGDEIPHAPHVVATAQPWPGAVAVYRSESDADYRLDTLLPARGTLGVTLNDLDAAAPGLLDRGGPLEVRLTAGVLQSVGEEALLGGANLAAIGDGTPGNWEVFQFAETRLVAPDTYWLSMRLRGQAGSDALMQPVWPAGSRFVLLDGRPRQIDLAPSLRRVAQHFRIGPARRGYDDPSYRHFVEAFDGNGLRPLSPCHLEVMKRPDSAYDLNWIRRTRVGGEGWDTPEVPLGEESERYLLRISAQGSLLRTQEIARPRWTYTVTDQQNDGLVLPFEVSVAQVSALYGPGPAAKRIVGA
ncbi:host specificity protein [Sulfitobacter alexandrii]|uniref:Host specificity protein n=1 Tax=Sulfitobacter alexandrii TaxID=1917485 RepID=A0A1J0WHK8_9RHOB|nr:glycoside hydrolase/phage tail family protein [Sulfitobacter alexandrii]APE43809.1 host specificity protein [Sulfitobacter alexandrii]